MHAPLNIHASAADWQTVARQVLAQGADPERSEISEAVGMAFDDLDQEAIRSAGWNTGRLTLQSGFRLVASALEHLADIDDMPAFASRADHYRQLAAAVESAGDLSSPLDARNQITETLDRVMRRDIRAAVSKHIGV